MILFFKEKESLLNVKYHYIYRAIWGRCQKLQHDTYTCKYLVFILVKSIYKNMFYSFCYLTNNFNLKLNIKLLRNIFQLLFSPKSKSKYYYKHTILFYCMF